MNAAIRQVAMGCRPDPTKFTVTRLEHHGGNTIVMANYGGATFGGEKLMVMRGVYDKFDVLDPHFLNEEYPVVGRFIPTDEGWELARMVANSLNPNTHRPTHQAQLPTETPQH